MIGTNDIINILSEKIAIPEDFIIGEIYRKPNVRGCAMIKGNWYLYTIDDRGGCICTGPFKDCAIIYACALDLHVAKIFKEYEFSDEEYDTYMDSHLTLDKI